MPRDANRADPAPSPRRRGPAAPPGRGAVVLLSAAALAAVALGVAAILATAAHRDAVDRSLDRYARIAAWQLAAHTTEALERALERTLWPVRRFGVVDDEGFPPVSVLAAAAPESDDCPCPLPFAARFYIRLDLETDRLDMAGEAMDPRRASALRSVLADAATRTGETLLRPWADGPDTMFLALTSLPSPAGSPAAVYGAAVPPSAVAPSLSGSLGEAELLPPSLAPGLEADELFHVRILDQAERVIFRSGQVETTSHRATAALGSSLGSLRVDLALTPDARTALAPAAGTPPWILACLLIGAGGLVWAAFRSLATERRLLATRERYVTALSHDLRTPLAEIQLFAETLRLGRDRDEEERTRYLELIELETRRLGDVIENALLVGRGAGAMPELEPVDLTSLAREEVARWERLSPTTRLRVAGGPGSAWARGRAGPLRRILANLIDNALKHGAPDEPVEVAVEADGGRARLRVTDRGPGIAPADRDRIFEPFVRLPFAHGRSAGSGVGLAVVKELTRAMEGSVWVEDAQSEGTTFVVEFDQAEPPRSSGSAEARERAP